MPRLSLRRFCQNCVDSSFRLKLLNPRTMPGRRRKRKRKAASCGPLTFYLDRPGIIQTDQVSFACLFTMVPKEGFEPSRGVAPVDFESTASAVPPLRLVPRPIIAHSRAKGNTVIMNADDTLSITRLLPCRGQIDGQQAC